MNTIRWRLALPFVVLSVLVIGGTAWYTASQMQKQIQRVEEERLIAEGRLVADGLADSWSAANSDEIQKLVNVYAGALQARITVIKLDGVVVGESEVSPLFMENHLSRPEVRKALETGLPASDIRFSSTLLTHFLYVAVPIRLNGTEQGIVRLAVSLAAIRNTQLQINRTLLLIAAVAIILLLILAFMVSEYTVKPLRQIAHTADKFSRRIFDQTEQQGILDRRDEIGVLGRSLHAMGLALQEQFAVMEDEQEKLFAILTAMTDGVAIVDQDGKVVLLNPAASLIFSITEPAALGKSLTETLRNHQIVDLWKESRDSNEQKTLSMELPAGRTYIQVVSTPLGETVQNATLLLFQDLTRMRRLETVRQDFVSNVSHELRTPMAAIKSLAETLDEGALEDPPAARRFLQLMQQEIDSMAQLVQELLELSRIESGKVKIEKKPVNVKGIVRLIVDRMQNQAQRAGLELTGEVDPGVEIASMDAERIQQVLLNLVHNAIKFTPPGGKVKISAEHIPGSIKISVKDTGVGISELDLPRIFERFYKSDRARSGSGTGLGLSIARHIVEAHHGEIWAESQSGQGSTFSFTIPE